MNLTPHSMRSPVSPYEQQRKHSFASQIPCYPTTPQPEQNQNRGLGLFGCGLQQPQSTVHELPPSPQLSDGWSHPLIMEQEYSSSSQPPNINTHDFNPFSGFSSTPNTGMLPGSSPDAPGLVFCPTPSSTNLPSPHHRSSVSSSGGPSETYSQHGPDFIYTPKVKVEDASEWYHSAGNNQVVRRNTLNTTQCLSPYSAGVSPVSASGEDAYRTHAEWSKHSTLAYPLALQNHSSGHLPPMDDAPSVLPSGGRIKKKRQRTTQEEATHHCGICGKLFKRSYNYKSHLETHNPDRKYPHPCQHVGADGETPCTKKFQRKTDLDRHYDSVHRKIKNHQCSLCGNRFARRDTLRRHTEDGCQKRFELGFRDGPGFSGGRLSFHRSYSMGGMPPQGSLVPMSSGIYSRSEMLNL